MRRSRDSLLVTCLAAMLFCGAAFAQQKGNKDDTSPVAGTATSVVGITVEEVMVVARGWSVKKNILGKNVVNDKGEKLGKVEDIIISPEKSLSYAIVSVGGFLGMGEHNIAIPIGQLKQEKDRFVLAGATKDVLKGLPKFEYSEKNK